MLSRPTLLLFCYSSTVSTSDSIASLIWQMRTVAFFCEVILAAMNMVRNRQKRRIYGRSRNKKQQSLKNITSEGLLRQNKNLPEWSRNKLPLTIGLLIIVCAVVFVAHWPAFNAGALSFDDTQYLTENKLVQNPSWTSAKRFLTEVLRPSTVGGYYQPLTSFSLMLYHAMGGRADYLMPFHRTSLILHVAHTTLVIILLYLLFGRIWIAAAVGLLFGIHPMTVEPIPWVGERKTLLAAFFAVWCLVLYVRYTHKNDKRFYVGSVIMYILALMSKPTSTPLPMLMLLMDFWPMNRLKWRTVWEKLPFFAIAGISVVITYISQSTTSGASLPGEYGPWRVPLVLCHNIVFYLYKIIWPVNLSSHYAFPKPLDL